jgi:hypothetical protein
MNLVLAIRAAQFAVVVTLIVAAIVVAIVTPALMWMTSSAK